MAKSKTIDLSTLDQQITKISQQVKDRFGIVKVELDKLAEQYERLTGESLLNGAAPAAKSAAKKGKPTTSETTGKKWTRKAGVSLEWITGHLKGKAMTLKALQGIAEGEKLSGLSVLNVLRANKNKFKAAAGEKQAGARGKVAQVWSVK